MSEYAECPKCKYVNERADGEHCKYCTLNACQFTLNFKPMTNADRIRNMSDEELADFLGGNCDKRMPNRFCAYPFDYEMCRECYFEWLQAEVKEGENNA